VTPDGCQRPAPQPRPARARRPPIDDLVPHIGTDEAGKGDYFGPLVCAACYLDADVTRTLRALGVRDSKRLSDRRIRALAGQIRAHLPGRYAVVTVRPLRYNSLDEELRSEGKNLNSLVAWGHARAIRDLFGHGVRAEYAVIDKFADERYLHERLRKNTNLNDQASAAARFCRIPADPPVTLRILRTGILRNRSLQRHRTCGWSVASYRQRQGWLAPDLTCGGSK
jgi:ribonuclease HIII